MIRAPLRRPLQRILLARRGAIALVCASVGCGSGDDAASPSAPTDSGPDGIAIVYDAASEAEGETSVPPLADAVGTADVDSSLDAGPVEASTDATEDGVGDDSTSTDGALEATAPPSCPIAQTAAVAASSAASSGFSGGDNAFFALFGGACGIPSDCVPACVSAGGTPASCASGSECLPGEATDGGTGCAPPPYWTKVNEALSESGMTTDAALDVVVDDPYDDGLVLRGFGVSIPDDATISGIAFQVRRATLGGNAVDASIRIVKAGAVSGTDHATTTPWAVTPDTSLTAYAQYGGAYDLWGEEWTVADVRASGFGISIAPRYTGPSDGNEFVYLDSVRVVVFYTRPCD